jgi:hypothetical protein
MSRAYMSGEEMLTVGQATSIRAVRKWWSRTVRFRGETCSGSEGILGSM